MKSAHDNFVEESRPLKITDVQLSTGSTTEIPTLKQFPAAMKRLFMNKLLMCNILSGIFYILGASAYFTFMSKYLEVQFHKSAADATIITGQLNIFDTYRNHLQLFFRPSHDHWRGLRISRIGIHNF